MDCTIEWEVLPQDMPDLVAEFGTRTKGNAVFADQDKVENIAIVLQAQAIVRDKGVEYGVQDLLVGTNREKFQEDFRKELKKHCEAKKVVIRSAFIRNIDIPEQYMKQIRDKQIAAETNLTNKFREDTNKSNAEVAKEESAIEAKVKDVEYETQKMVTALDTEAKNITSLNEAEIEKLNQEFQAKIAALDAQKSLEVGKAKTDVTKLKETAKSGLYKMKMDVFKNDGDAFLRYSLADQLNPDLKVRLFHSGPGTFWTNMGDKNMNLLLPVPGGGDKISAPAKPIVGPPNPERLTGKDQ
jgi:SPFH domain / Band 7 family